MKKLLIVLALVVAFVAILYISRGKDTDTASVTASPTDTVSNNPTVSATPTATASPLISVSVGTVKTFNVTGKSFSFSPSTITVNKGDTVKIVFTNTEGNHDWVVDEFNARTKIISGGQTDTVEFVADKAGTFEYYCSVGTHRQLGMKGTLVVK